MTGNLISREDRSALGTIGALVNLTSDMKRQLERETAIGFSPFRYLRNDELGLSRIIADFLDPAGSHRQGDVFLQSFLARIGLQCKRTEKAHVGCEVTLDGRRIDILLRGDDWRCVIENKPYAVDQSAQLADYWASARQRAGNNARIVYLSGPSCLPDQSSMPTEQLDKLLAEKVLFIFGLAGASADQKVNAFDDLLSEWRELARPLRLRVFIDEFRRFLAERFGGEKDAMAENTARALASQLLNDPTLATTAVKVATGASEIHAEVFARFFAAIEAEVEALARKQVPPLEVDIISRIGRYDVGGTARLSFRPAGADAGAWQQNDLSVTIEVPRGARAFLGIGIAYPANQQEVRQRVLRSDMFDQIRKGLDLPDAESATEGGWPLWWELRVMGGDRLQDLTSTEALYDAIESGKIKEIAGRITKMLVVTDWILGATEAAGSGIFDNAPKL